MTPQTTTLKLANGGTIEIPVKYQHFYLDYSSDPEAHGWEREQVVYIMQCVQNGDFESLDMDADLMNDIGTFFDDGVCVEPNIEMAVYWYEQAIKNGSDLARSNLADILRKGSKGYPKDLVRAFELYKTCGLPYAHYRVGEFYEHGWGTEQNLDLAKAYYQQAYNEGHPLAKKKLQEWNFMK